MKTLYLIGGAMGVGKTAACQQLKRLLPDCVFLDGDWCWDGRPLCGHAGKRRPWCRTTSATC